MNIVILDARTVTGFKPDVTFQDLERLGILSIYEHTDSTKTANRLAEADAVLTNKVVIDRTVMEACPRLKYIGVLATGYNVVDINEAHRRGITVTNIPDYSTASVAQHTFALLLNITNKVAHYAKENRNGVWCAAQDFCYWDEPLTELAGHRFGIIGMGNIGCAVARIAMTMGMEVVAVTSRKDLPEGVKSVTLDTLLCTSDVISLHCPLTDNNRGFINKESLSRMKAGAILVNTGRGPLVVEADVAAALENNHLGAYLADVLSVEPAESNNPLLQAPRSYLTPHIAWATHEARTRLIEIAAANLNAYIEGHPQNLV